MRWGLEGRCPFLDGRLAALAIPPIADRKQSARVGKLLLRRAMNDLIPSDILARPKRGFGSPVAQWLAGPLRTMVGTCWPIARRGCAIPLTARKWIHRIVAQALRGRGNGHQAALLVSSRAGLTKSRAGAPAPEETQRATQGARASGGLFEGREERAGGGSP